jgi:hypothetical protein
MSAFQDVHGSTGAGGKGPRKLAVARHAHGVDAIGWVLLGFVLGAGAAIAVLLNANFSHRAVAPEPAVAVRQAPPLRFTLAPVRTQPVAIVQPAPALAPVLPPVTPVARTPAPAPGKAAAPPRKLAAAPEPVAEDAAAAGMTSRIQGQDSDLY